MINPSFLQYSCIHYTNSSIPTAVLASKTTSSANSNMNIGLPPLCIKCSLFRRLFAQYAPSFSSMYGSTCSKYIPNNNGEHGQPYFTPLLIQMALLVPYTTLAWSPSYIRFASFRVSLSLPNRDPNISHIRTRFTLS